jgi:hypothetical protein
MHAIDASGRWVGVGGRQGRGCVCSPGRPFRWWEKAEVKKGGFDDDLIEMSGERGEVEVFSSTIADNAGQRAFQLHPAPASHPLFRRGLGAAQERQTGKRALEGNG